MTARSLMSRSNSQPAARIFGPPRPAGVSAPGGPVIRERIPQGHKVALEDIVKDMPVRRYDVGGMGHHDRVRMVVRLRKAAPTRYFWAMSSSRLLSASAQA